MIEFLSLMSGQLMRMAGYPLLLWNLLMHGRFNGPTYDFNRARREALEGLANFVPSDFHRKMKEQSSPKRSSLLYALRSVGSALTARIEDNIGYVNDGKIAYIRIPKSASTSAGSSILKSRYPDLQNKEITSTQWNYLIDANIRKEIDKNLEYFTIVRNPLERLVSVYRDFFEREHRYFHFADYLPGLFSKEMTFEQFVDRLRIIPDPAKDQHLKPQYHFIDFFSNVVNVRVLKLDDHKLINQFLTSHHIHLSHQNMSGVYNYMDYYTPTTLKMVRNIYQEDIARFEY